MGFNLYDNTAGDDFDDAYDYASRSGDHPPRSRLMPKSFRVVLAASVEADSPEEAQIVAGLLLAGRPTPQGHEAAPLTGPGSWAPDLKRVDEIVDPDAPVYHIGNLPPFTTGLPMASPEVFEWLLEDNE